MNVGIAYAKADRQVWLKIDVPEGSTIREVIEKSGILNQFPEIDLKKNKVGIFGKTAKLETKVEEGQRVEIYRSITCDPKTVQRRKMADDDDDDD